MEYLSVDSVEKGSHAVCEDENGNEVILDFKSLPKGTKESDMIFMDDFGKWHVDKKFTKERKMKISDLMKEIFEKWNENLTFVSVFAI